jgi:hypothetical protein
MGNQNMTGVPGFPENRPQILKDPSALKLLEKSSDPPEILKEILIRKSKNLAKNCLVNSQGSLKKSKKNPGKS